MTSSEHVNKQMLKTTLSIPSKDINKNLRKYGSRSEKINETLGYILNRKK